MISHERSISAIADTSSVNYRGRAISVEMSHLLRMSKVDWRKRLEDAVAKDGRSLRDISLAAGLSHGYLHGILRDDKEPTMDRFERICRSLGVSTAFIMIGLDVTPETEAIIKAIDGNPARRKALLDLLSAE